MLSPNRTCRYSCGITIRNSGFIADLKFHQIRIDDPLFARLKSNYNNTGNRDRVNFYSEVIDKDTGTKDTG